MNKNDSLASKIAEMVCKCTFASHPVNAQCHKAPLTSKHSLSRLTKSALLPQRVCVLLSANRITVPAIPLAEAEPCTARTAWVVMPIIWRPESIAYLSLRTHFLMVYSDLGNDRCCKSVTVLLGYQEIC